MDKTIALEAQGIVKSLGGISILRGVSFSVPEGGVTGIIGASGSGKSTLLRCLNLLLLPDEGHVLWYGKRLGWKEKNGQWTRQKEKEILPSRTEIGMVFQSYNLFPHMSAIDNIAEAPVTVLKRRRSEVLEHAHMLLAKVRLTHRADAYPHQMSGGEQQRVAIARALAMQPRALLFDEVTSALDPELKSEVLNVIRDLAEEGMTMVLVSHEMGFMKRIAKELIFMSNGDIHERGSAEELLTRPKTEALSSFLSRVHD